jgi:hypothetical protein
MNVVYSGALPTDGFGAVTGRSATKRAWRKAATISIVVALLAVFVKDLAGFAPSYALIVGQQH